MLAHVAGAEAAMPDEPVGELADALERVAIRAIVARQFGRVLRLAACTAKHRVIDRARSADLFSTRSIVCLQIFNKTGSFGA